MKKNIFIALILILALALTGCADNTGSDELPAIIFLVRSDISDVYDPEEIERQNIAVKSFGFYDKDGNYYTSANPDLNALDNKTLVAEYNAGNLTDKLICTKSCDADALAEQYAKLRKICRKKQIEIVYPESVPSVQAERVVWYGLYYDRNGDVQYQIIHEKGRMTDFDTDNDTINEIYDWVAGTLKK